MKIQLEGYSSAMSSGRGLEVSWGFGVMDLRVWVGKSGFGG